MKLLAIAAALLLLQPQSAWAQPASAPSDALVDRLLAALPDRAEIGAAAGAVDPAELGRLEALNPGKEAKVRSVLQANLACTGPAIEAGTLRMLRTVARNLGDARVKKLVSFYEGPDYAAFGALAERMESKPAPSAEDEAAMAKFMETYPLQAFLDQMGRAEEIIAADKQFMAAAMKCAEDQMKALDAAGLKSN